MGAVSGPFEFPTMLNGEEVVELMQLLADVHDGYGADDGVRDAAAAAWTLLGNRAASQAGVGERPEQEYQPLMRRLQSRSRPWRG